MPNIIQRCVFRIMSVILAEYADDRISRLAYDVIREQCDYILSLYDDLEDIND